LIYIFDFQQQIITILVGRFCFSIFGSQKRDEQMHKETNKLLFHPLATAGLSAELESSLDSDVLLKGHGKGIAKGSSLGGTIVTMLNAYMGPLGLNDLAIS